MNIINEVRKYFKTAKFQELHFQTKIQEYVCKIQQIFSLFLVVFFVINIIIVSSISFFTLKQLNKASWISLLQLFLCIGAYILFSTYLKTHKKYILPMSYLNIFQVLFLFEVQYFLYDEYMSFAVIMGITIVSSLTIIGHIGKYSSIVLIISVIDIAISCYKKPNEINSYVMNLYILDNLFIMMIAISTNFYTNCLKYKQFEDEEKLIYLSEKDGLTGLCNRKALENAVNNSALENTISAFIILDLDNFKTLNDTFGHGVGDDCLREVGDKLKRIFREVDCVSRLGGDEFVIFISDVKNTDWVMKRTKTMIENIPKTYTKNKDSITVTCSIGVAFCEEKGNDLYEKLYQSADMAMYHSKKNGKNCVFCFNDLQSQIKQKNI